VREDFAARLIQRPFLKKLRGRAHDGFFDPDGAAGINALGSEYVNSLKAHAAFDELKQYY